MLLSALSLAAALAATPPPGCRVFQSSENKNTYQCILCPSTAPKLRSDTEYFVNAQCSFEPRSGVVAHASPIVAQDGTSITSLPDAVVQLYATINVAGSGVSIFDLVVSHRVNVVSSPARDLRMSNVVVSEDTVGFSITPPLNNHDVDVDGLNINALSVPHRVDNTIATLYHSVGSNTISCTPDSNDRVVVQPVVPSGTSNMPNCQVVNMTAIFDAYGSAFVYDLYDTPTPSWVTTLRMWALTFSLSSIVLLALRFRKKHTPSNTSAPKPTSMLQGFL
tara:strand:- start:4892 stop:5725 length:834 start_codon:yes stop_codon:yes gene_type:complete